MNINAVTDAVLDYLETKHSRVYRNKTPQAPIFPYVVFIVESVVNSMPSEDLYLNINIYENPDKSVRVIEDLVDLIDGNGDGLDPTGLNQKIINTAALSLRFDREQRQYVSGTDLINAQMVNLRYVIRAYFK